MIKCGKCKGMHDSIDEVRGCYGAAVKPAVVKGYTPEAMTEKQKDYIKSLNASRQMPDTADNGFAVVLMQRNLDVLAGNKFISRDEASDIIEWLLCLPFKPRPTRKGKISCTPGHYALETSDGVKFYRVTAGKRKWEGWTFVVLLHGSPGHFAETRLSRGEQDEIMIEIQKVGEREAAMLFGRKTKVCGMCFSPLTTPQSRAAGIGPVCAAKQGWYYPKLQEALEILEEG